MDPVNTVALKVELAAKSLKELIRGLWYVTDM